MTPTKIKDIERKKKAGREEGVKLGGGEGERKRDEERERERKGVCRYPDFLMLHPRTIEWI